ncbi:MAG: glycosyltransferase [Candidatus Hodarchaeales archaeon]
MKKVKEIHLLVISLSLGIGFSRSHIIVKTPRDIRYQPFDLCDRVKIYPTQSRNRCTFLIDSWRLGIKIMRDYPINLITTQDPFGTGLIGYLLSRTHGIPLCVHNVCDFIDNPWWIKEKKVNYLLNFIGKKILFNADSIRVDNNDERKKLINLKIPSEKIWNIPFIVNNARKFINCEEGKLLRRELLGKKHEKMVLFIGRFEKQKDLPTFFKAARCVLGDFPKTLFVVVGEGKEETKARRSVEELSIEKNVLFVGWVDFFDLPKYYRASDIFVLSSTYETSPMVLILARLSGKAIVTTNISGARDLVEDGVDGFIVPIKDYEGMSRRISILLEKDLARERMGEYGRRKIEPLLDEDEIIRKAIDMYHFSLSANDN